MKGTSFIPAQLRTMDAARLAGYIQNLSFYQGNHWPTTSRHRQLVFNYAKVSIDKVTSFLMQGLTFTCFPAREGEDILARVRRAEAVLRQVYNDNRLAQLDYETEVDTAVLGDGCYKVIWDQDDKRIRITAPDVSGIFAWWLGDDLSRVWRVASRYQLTRDEVYILYGRTTDKKSITVTELWTKTDFDLFLDTDLIESKPNPYGFIPFIIFPNLRDPKHFWGVSDIPIIIQPQRELNRALSQLSRILELSGNPIAVLENVAEAEDIKVQPGALWTIPEDAKAYLLDLLQGGGVRLHVDYIDLLYRALHDVSETPRAAWGGVERDLSGTALRIELGSLIQKVLRKRLIRTSVYYRRNAMILRLVQMYQKESFDGVNHRVVWGHILPQDIGRDASDDQVIADAFDWDLQELYDQLVVAYDPNLATYAAALARAERVLRTLSLEAKKTQIIVPTNVGQELLDVVDITDPRCGVDAEAYRVKNIMAEYDRSNGRYDQVLTLGAP